MRTEISSLKNTNIFTVKQYTETDKPSWNSFVEDAKNGTFLFNRNFMDYHSNRFNDFSLLIFKEDVLFALLPANRVDNKLISHQGLTYGSFVLLDTAKLFDVFKAFKASLQFLNKVGINSLEIRNIPTFYNTMPSDELAYILYKAEAKLIKRDALMVIDNDHKLRFQKNRREGINKAIRNGLTIKIDENFEGFWNEVLIPNLKQKHGISPVHSLAEIKLLASRFPDNIQQVNVYKDGKVVAGTTVFLTKTTIHPQYVSGNAAKNNYGSLDLAYDFIINHYKKEKRYFDFNISSEKNGAVLNKGLVFWKESCGARTFVADNYELQTSVYKTLELQIK